MAGNICDCCMKKDSKTVVCCSMLGAISFAYCPVCLAMAAEPSWVVESLIADLELDCIRENLPLTVYEKKTDRYKDVRKGYIPITFKDGTKVDTRAEALSRIKDLG